MAKKKAKQIESKEITPVTETPVTETPVTETPVTETVKPRHTPEQLKKLLSNFSRITLRARGIID